MPVTRSVAALIVAASLVHLALAVPKPHPMTLHSAYTPFGPAPQYALNLTGVPHLAAQAKRLGVNTVFVSGSMSLFDTMTVAERKALITAWVNAARAEELYTIVNVGTTVRAEVLELARHAHAEGADAIATVPPYYATCGDIPTLVQWLSDIAAVVPETVPLWYYHIPGTTRTTFAMADLMPAVAAAGLTQLTELGGIKYVSSDTFDFLSVSNWVAEGGHNATVLFAPEPKLQGFALQNPYGGAVLAEDFYAPTYLRMRKYYEQGAHAAAIREQNWKYMVDGIFRAYGGTAAKRMSYFKSCGVWMGDSRPPVPPFNHSQYSALIANLTEVGFFSQKPPYMLDIDVEAASL